MIYYNGIKDSVCNNRSAVLADIWEKFMRILLAEDDKELNKALAYQLTAAGYTVDSCYDGEEALYLGVQNIHDIILLDRMLPYMEGTEVLKRLRQNEVNAPILLITALGTLEDKVTGLDLGADDYLVKPFAFEELMARIRCISRRSPILTASEDKLACQDITYDPVNLWLTGPASDCTLTRREGDLLETLIRSPKQTLPRETLLLKVWGPDSEVESGNLDNYIHFLRRRLKAVGSNVKIKTVRGVGYHIVPQEGK